MEVVESHTITIPVPALDRTITRTWTRRTHRPMGGWGPWETSAKEKRWTLHPETRNRAPLGEQETVWILATPDGQPLEIHADNVVAALRAATRKVDVDPLLEQVQATSAEAEVEAAERAGDARQVFEALAAAIEAAPAELAARRALLVEQVAREQGTNVRAAQVLGVSPERVGQIRKEYERKHRRQS